MKKFKFPSVFSFSRSIEAGRGYYFEKQGSDGELKPLRLREERTTGTFSGYKPHKNDAQEMAGSNPVYGDAAYISSDCDTFVLKFSVKPIANAFYADNTNDADALEFMNDFVTSYAKVGGMEFLAERYMNSIATGTFLFRNLTIADNIEVKVIIEDETVVFVREQRETEEFKSDVKRLAKIFAEGLINEEELKIFEVEASGYVGAGQEVFPSQVFDSNKEARSKDNEVKSKILVSEDVFFDGEKVRQAMMTRGKIGNAIRTIDTWYADGDVRALPVEPYGVDRKLGLAHRYKSGDGFYHLMEKKGVEFLKQIKEASSAEELQGDIHFVVACLIRGGVLSGEKKKK